MQHKLPTQWILYINCLLCLSRDSYAAGSTFSVAEPASIWDTTFWPGNLRGRFCNPSLCLFVRLSVRPSVCPSVRPSIRPSVRLSVRPSVYSSVRLSVRPSVHLSGLICFFFWISFFGFFAPSLKLTKMKKQKKKKKKLAEKSKATYLLLFYLFLFGFFFLDFSPLLLTKMKKQNINK